MVMIVIIVMIRNFILSQRDRFHIQTYKMSPSFMSKLFFLFLSSSNSQSVYRNISSSISGEQNINIIIFDWEVITPLMTSLSTLPSLQA